MSSSTAIRAKAPLRRLDCWRTWQFDGDGRTYAGMGADFQDYDNDGIPDLFVTTLANQKYALYRNSGDGTFTYVTNLAGLGSATLLHSGSGTKFFDYDNDGFKDLIVAQGHDEDNIQLEFPQLRYKEPLLLMHNEGNGTFIDVSDQSGDIFPQAWAGRGRAVGDLDNDGREDLVVTTNDGPAYVLRNETKAANHWLTLLLVGHKSNRDAGQYRQCDYPNREWFAMGGNRVGFGIFRRPHVHAGFIANPRRCAAKFDQPTRGGA